MPAQFVKSCLRYEAARSLGLYTGTNVYSALYFSKAKPWVETHWGIMNVDWEHDIVQDTGTARGHSRDTEEGAREGIV